MIEDHYLVEHLKYEVHQIMELIYGEDYQRGNWMNLAGYMGGGTIFGIGIVRTGERAVNSKRSDYFQDAIPTEEDQEIYQDLSTIKLEKHIERLGNKKVQVSDGKEVTSSGKFAGNTKFADLSEEDRQKVLNTFRGSRVRNGGGGGGLGEKRN